MSGVYVFDSWLRIVKGKVAPIGANIVLQYHDEFLGMCLKFQKERIESLIVEATKELNEEIKLNIEFIKLAILKPTLNDIHIMID